MCNKQLRSIMTEIRNGDMSRFGELYGVFAGLIHCYERRLEYDDAGQELTVFLLELIYNTDLSRFCADESEGLKRYIAVSLRNRYIALSKTQQKNMLASNELYDGLGFEQIDLTDSISLAEGLRLLTERQRLAVIFRYIYGYSDAEIADRLHITRQAVHRLETRGLDILRNYYGI